MANTLTPFADITEVVGTLLGAEFIEIGDRWGTREQDIVAGGWYLLLQRVGGASTRLNGYPTLDLDLFAPSYAQGVSLSERISAYLLGYPRSVRIGSRLIVIDDCEELRPPVEVPWDDNVRRFGATYQFSVRR